MRVAIVNDQRLPTEALRRVVLSDPRHLIAWTAADGDEAVRLCKQDVPDVILMDLVMPKVNGAEATRRIMAEKPVAILVVTASVQTNFALVCEALGHGAYDAVNLPALGKPDAGAELLGKLARVETINRRLRGQGATVPEVPIARLVPDRVVPRQPLVALGTSTGGPLALSEILGGLPAGFPASVLVVQHLGPEYMPEFVSWLQSRTPLPVRSVVGGEMPQAGTVFVASSADHLLLRPDGRLGYEVEPKDYPFRPSVDVLFHSLARYWPQPGLAAVLTGIGRDGAEGLLALRRAGWRTIAQDQETSVVHGMPKAAVQLGAACQVLPLPEIAAFLCQQVKALASGTP